MDWPWQYSFPPFFTIQVSILLILTHAHDPWQWLIPQPHSATRAKQLEAWRHLVLNYCQVQNRVFWFISLSIVKSWTNNLLQVHTISVLDLADAGDLPLFHNAEISRRLPAEAILTVLEDLAQQWVNFVTGFCSKCIFSVGTWNGRTRANAEVTYSGSHRLSWDKRYTSEP